MITKKINKRYVIAKVSAMFFVCAIPISASTIEFNAPDTKYINDYIDPIYGHTGAEVYPDVETIQGESNGPGPEGQYCCTAEIGEGGMVVSDPVVSLPVWLNYQDSCQGAKDAWDAFITALTAHEQSHVDHIKQWKKDNIGNWDQQLLDIVGHAHAGSEQEACQNALSDLIQKVNEFSDSMADDIMASDNTHDELGETVPLASVSC